MLIQSSVPIPPPDAGLLSWLRHEHSLTKKLKTVAGDARLEILEQRWDHTPDGTAVLCREIIMWAFDSPCWYARTLVPEVTYYAHEALFARLKTEPLGDLIFQGTDIKRVSLESYAISKQSPEYAWVCKWRQQDASWLWVRQSEQRVNAATQHPFFLKEILLPGLMRYLSCA